MTVSVTLGPKPPLKVWVTRVVGDDGDGGTGNWYMLLTLTYEFGRECLADYCKNELVDNGFDDDDQVNYDELSNDEIIQKYLDLHGDDVELIEYQDVVHGPPST